MGCNCKKTIDTINEKYGDGIKRKDTTNPLMKIFEFLGRIIIGILSIVIVTVMIVPMLLYLFVCMIVGKDVKVRLKNPNKGLKNRKIIGKQTNLN